jgi:hypothetical protein
VTPSTLAVRLTRGEKIAGMLHDVDLPLTAVREVTVVPDPVRSLRGWRAPGLGLPHRAIGTWRRHGERTLVSIRRHQPAVRVRLEGTRWSSLLIGADDAETVAAALTAAR